MPENTYKEALKLGQKEYRARKAMDESPYLPALDDLLPLNRTLNGEYLGLMEIPSEFIIGTKTRSRTNSFASNFMPIQDADTEFAGKWQKLCESHLSEGIQEPIKAYEYLNRYYVEEGNKRVSVLKFFDAPMITGRVTRILPEKSDDTAMYYKLLDFSRLSGVQCVELSGTEDYQILQSLVGKAPGEPWAEEERKQFLSTYYLFREAYRSYSTAKHLFAPGDAMLIYMRIYGYETLRDSSLKEIRQSLSKIRDELSEKTALPGGAFINEIVKEELLASMPEETNVVLPWDLLMR